MPFSFCAGNTCPIMKDYIKFLGGFIMLKEKYENAKKFMKDHKAEFIAGGLVIGGLMLRQYDKKTIEKHLIDILGLMKKAGDIEDKIVDAVVLHDKELTLINELLGEQGKLNKVNIEVVEKITENIVELKDNK